MLIDELVEQDAGKSQESSLEILMMLGVQQIEKEKEIKDLELVIKEKQGELSELRNKRIPEMMNAVGTGDFSLKTGERIEIKKIYSGSIKDHEEEFFAYLAEYDLDDIIKNIVTVTLDKDESFRALELVENLENMGFSTDHQKNIHGGTLKAFIKERLEALEELKEEYIKQGGLPVKEGMEGWPEYLQFAKDRGQEQDLKFPKDLCNCYVFEQSKITIPKKKK